MDHHDGHDMNDEMCSMNMLFNTDWRNLCIVFPSWHIRSFSSFLLSLAAIVLLGAGYEAVREYSRRVDSGTSGAGAARADAHEEMERSSLLPSDRNKSDGRPRAAKSVRALLYAIQVFYSFFIMLLFMTYNLWIMLAVAGGAFVGFMMFGGSSSTRSVACH